MLVGTWITPQGGGHLIYRLRFCPDGTGDFDFLTPGDSGSCRFAWRLSPDGNTISFTPMGPTIRDCHLFNKDFRIAIASASESQGAMPETLVLTSWQEASRLELREFTLESPAGLRSVEYIRRIETESKHPNG